MNASLPRRRIRWRRWLFLWLPLLFVSITTFQVLVLRWVNPPTSAFMIERRIAAWRDGESGFRLQYRWRPLGEISRWLPISVVASEDQKFPEHDGFDFEAIEKDLKRNRKGKRVRGASTISQQVAKNLFLWGGRNYVRKGLEAWYTVLIEHLWSKQRIVEVYVNIAEFGDGIYGADAAAHALFGTAAARLTPAQCARLASVLPNPRHWSAAKPDAYVLRHAAWIQRQIGQLGGPGYLREGSR